MFYFYFQNEGKDSYDAIDIESSEEDDQYNKGQTEGTDAPQDDQPITKKLVIELLVCILAFVGRVSVSLSSQLYFPLQDGGRQRVPALSMSNIIGHVNSYSTNVTFGWNGPKFSPDILYIIIDCDFLEILS